RRMETATVWDSDEPDSQPAGRDIGTKPRHPEVAGGHHRDAAAVEQTEVVARRLEQSVGARGDALPRHPARVPANRLDRHWRIEASRRAPPVGAEHVAPAGPDPGNPEEGTPIEVGAPLVDHPVAIRVARQPLGDP